MTKAIGIALTLVLGLCSCATTDLPSIQSAESLQLQPDEQRLWNRSREEQRRLNRSTEIYRDPALSAYVNGVANKLLPDETRGKNLSFQVYVIKNPLLNAFAYPNGVLYIHTGMLARMENEAQLATLLGHEMTHVTHRHAVENFRSVKNATAFLATVQVAAIPFGAYGNIAGMLGTVGAMAAVTGYSRDLEREADFAGLERMVAAGYDPHEAPRLFEHLKQDVEEQDVKEPFFFGSHPRLQERIANYEQMIRIKYAHVSGVKNVEQFQTVISPVLLDNAQLDLAMGRFQPAERTLAHILDQDPQNARAHYFLGEVCRQRAETGDLEQAEIHYRNALQLNPGFPEPHRALGYLYYKRGQPRESAAELEKYLTLAPDAADRSYIILYIEQMKKN